MSQELQFSDEYNKISVQDQCESEDICEEKKEIPMPSQELFLTLQREIDELKYQNKLLKKNHQTYITSSKSKLISEKPSTALTSDKQYLKASATKKGASKLQSIQQNKYSKTTAKLKSASLTPTESLTVQQKASLLLLYNSSVELQSIGIGIIKPAGNYIDIPESLSLTKEEYNAYKSSVRDLVEAFVITDITWAKQEKKVTLKLIEKFKASNPQFPNTAGDWAVKLMIKRVINNKRAYQRIRSQQEQGNDDNSDDNDHHSGNQPGKRVDRIDTNDIRVDKDDIHVHNEDDTCDIAQKNNDGSAGDQLNKNGKRVTYNEDDRRVIQKNSEESANIDNQRRVAADDTHDTCTPDNGPFKLIVNLPDSSEVSNTKKKPQNSRKKNETQRKKNNRRK
ncbi:hypothetical protein RhiirC2_833151 [Rhizophagus irregularis]|uniref:Uncharacterized protein n=1 Tax=Rhizophagus irregularis TaxID=588596 RepID=A0A2N1NX70_9GLOM|nr:hypothetical protein RhiirC2_833151 [Rhizophagus irregularis]